MVNINIEIPNDLHKRIKIYCAMNNITLKEFIISTLNNSLNLSDITKIKNKLKNNG